MPACFTVELEVFCDVCQAGWDLRGETRKANMDFLRANGWSIYPAGRKEEGYKVRCPNHVRFSTQRHKRGKNKKTRSDKGGHHIYTPRKISPEDRDLLLNFHARPDQQLPLPMGV